VGIGDELMVTGLVRERQATDPRRVLIEYEKGRPRWCELWDRNPRIAKAGQLGDFQTLRPRENYLRPYCSAKSEKQWTWKAYRPPVGEIYFAPHEKAFGKLNEKKILFGPSLKHGASPNKQWGVERWMKLALLLAGSGDLAQCGVEEQYSLPGVSFIPTTIRQAAALVASARLVICGEGALHHIAAAVGTPAIVIYGGYISPESTGYDGQVAFFRGGGLGCGMRVPCAHCAAAMASITPEEVAEAARGIL
jgi:ADP-heptose:LPS heptosyltransferase